MEDIYCDFDTVFDAIFDMIDSHDSYELSMNLENVNVGLIEECGEEGLGEFIVCFSDNIDVIRSDIAKVIFEYIGVFVVLNYKVSGSSTTFNAKIFNDIEDADEFYMGI